MFSIFGVELCRSFWDSDKTESAAAMDFSDSFFCDPFRTEVSSAVSIPEPAVKTEATASTVLSELVPSGLSSSFDNFEAFDALDLLPKLDEVVRVENVVATTESRKAHNYSPSLFMDESGVASLAETLTSQATFSFDIESELDCSRPPQPVASFAEECQDEKPDTGGLTYYGVLAGAKNVSKSVSKNVASAVAASTPAVGELDLSELPLKPKSSLAQSAAAAAAADSTTSTLSLSSGILPNSSGAAVCRKKVSEFNCEEDFKAYRARRERNNEASRRSRMKFRQKAREMEEEVQDLREENGVLKQQLQALTAAFEALRQRFEDPSTGVGGDSLLA